MEPGRLSADDLSNDDDGALPSGPPRCHDADVCESDHDEEQGLTKSSSSYFNVLR